MKHLFKKVPAFVVVCLIIVATVVFSVFASVSYNKGDVNKDTSIDDNDLMLILKDITGEQTLSADVKDLANYNDEDNIINILDVIALKKQILLTEVNKGWTQVY